MLLRLTGGALKGATIPCGLHNMSSVNADSPNPALAMTSATILMPESSPFQL